MSGTADFENEKRELAALLESGAFSRAPNLANLLTYVCQKYFEGKGDELKEYNLAVEALGRPADFDNKKDSVVRVEAHRLRKRLNEYYTSRGADHPIHIEIPLGQYAPRFVHKAARELVPFLANTVDSIQPASPALMNIDTVERPPAVFSPLTKKSRVGPTWILIAAALLSATAWLTVLMPGRTRAGMKSTNLPVNADLPARSGDSIRILAGAKEPYDDSFGNRWSADRFYEDGETFTEAQHPVFCTRDPKIYRSRREGIFRYNIPLKPGSYELRLYFAETLYGESNIASGGESTRIFQVRANGRTILESLDVISDVGPNSADIRVIKDISPDRDGLLHLSFEGATNIAFLNAIEITPGVPGKLLPIRIVAREHPYTDPEGRVWQADRFAKGGLMVNRSDPVSGNDDPELYHGERFGNITYSIPVAPGHYGVTLHFAELWFGPNKPGKGGAGDRIFDILCNGVALFRNVDIYKEAGGGNRALLKTFHNVEPTPQGRIQISLQPRRNYAAINAIEVVDESK